MSNAVPRRTEKPVTIHRPKSGKAKIIKFDRHAGVIVIDKAEPTSKIQCLKALVRKLLGMLKRSGPAPRAIKRTRVTKVRMKRR